MKVSLKRDKIMNNYKVTLLLTFIGVIFLSGCQSTKKIALVDNQVKNIQKNVVTMDLETGELK